MPIGRGSITQGTLTLRNGAVIDAGNILWRAGAMAHPLTRKLGARIITGWPTALRDKPHEAPSVLDRRKAA